MRNQKQRVVLNKQVSSLAHVNVWVVQGSTVSLILSLICINNFTDDLFSDDTSLISVVHKVNTLGGEANNDLVKINKWTYQ